MTHWYDLTIAELAPVLLHDAAELARYTFWVLVGIGGIYALWRLCWKVSV